MLKNCCFDICALRKTKQIGMEEMSFEDDINLLAFGIGDKYIIMHLVC